MRWSASLRRFLHELEAVLAWSRLEEVYNGPRWFAYVVALATRAGEGGGKSLAQRLALSGRMSSTVAAARRRMEQLLAVLCQKNVSPERRRHGG